MKNKLHKTRNKILSLISAIIPLLLLSGCTQQSNNPGVNTVSIKNLAFNPNALTVSNETTVTWINDDSVSHTVLSATGLFSSGTLTKGQSFSHTFTAPGTYNYTCGIHPSMRGTIIVQ